MRATIIREYGEARMATDAQKYQNDWCKTLSLYAWPIRCWKITPAMSSVQTS